MTDLPQGWEWATIDDLAAPERRAITDGPFGSNLKSAHYTDVGPRVLRLQNIGFGEFIDEEAHISEEHFESLRAHEVQAGDLVVASLGQDLPRACLVPGSLGPAIVKADCIRVRLDPSVSTGYVNYALQRPELRKAVAAQIHGVGRPRIGMKGVRGLTVPLPPRAEQERIVAAIEEHLSRLDAAEVSLSQGRVRLTVLRRRVIDGALEGAVARLGDLLVAPLRNGLSARASATGSIRVVTLTAVTRDEFTDVNTKLIDPGSRSVDDLWMKPGDIFVQRSNTPELVGTAAMYDGDPQWAIFPDLLIRVRVSTALLPEYAVLALRSSNARRYLQRSAQGIAGSMPKISQPILEGLELPVPGLERQKAIVAETTDQLDTLDRLAQQVTTAQRRIGWDCKNNGVTRLA